MTNNPRRLGAICACFMVSFLMFNVALAQPQPGLNVTGEIISLKPANASVIPVNQNFETHVKAWGTNNERFLVVIEVQGNIEWWDERRQMWVDLYAGTDLQDAKAVMPQQTVDLEDTKVVIGNLTHGTYRVGAILAAYYIDVEGQTILWTHIDSQTNHFIIQ